MTTDSSTQSTEARKMMHYDINRKSLGLALVLWFFLGTLGAHRFYLARYGSAIGILCLTLVGALASIIFLGWIFFLIVGIWLLVDLFLIFGIVRDHNSRLAAHLDSGGTGRPPSRRHPQSSGLLNR